MKTVGSCHQQTSIKIIDETGGSDPQPRSIRNSQNSPFKNYVNTISKHFFTKIDAMGQCQGNWIGNPQVELVFVYRPLISYGIAPFNFERTQSNDTKHLDSPWIKLTMSKSPRSIVRAVFIWNERQFLLDQAVLLDATTAPTKPPVPIDERIYQQFIRDYIDTDSVILSSSKAAKANALTNLSKRLPPDVIWLLRHSAIESDPPTPLRSTMDETIKQRADIYINLSKSLLDRRFASAQSEQRYDSVLDLKDVFNIDKYRIN
jgi:hypothetical protein